MTLSAVHSYDLYHIHFMSFSSYNGYKLNSHLTCFRRGFIAQSVEHRTGIAEAMGSIPVEPQNFYCEGLFLFSSSVVIRFDTFTHNYQISIKYQYMSGLY